MVGGGDGRISDQAGMPKNGMSCLPIASGSRLVAVALSEKSPPAYMYLRQLMNL